MVDKSEQTQAARLKEARKKAGFTSARAFAKSIDLDENRYTMYERGSRGLSRDMNVLKRIVVALDITADWLLFGGEDPLHHHRYFKADILGQITVEILRNLEEAESPDLPSEQLGALILAVANELKTQDPDGDLQGKQLKAAISTTTKPIVRGLLIAAAPQR